LFTQSESGITNLTDKIGLAGDEFNNLVFAETQFTKAILSFGVGAELFNADCHSGLNSA